MRDLRSKLKSCQPYLIQRDLYPKLFFRDDGRYTEKLIFKYAFIDRFRDEQISVKLDYYSRQGINKKLHQILDANKYLIEEFLNNQNVAKK